METPSSFIESQNPANTFEPVLRTAVSTDDVHRAVESARGAFTSWFALGQTGRIAALEKLAHAFQAREEEIANAIVSETGKPLREAKGEAKSLSARIRLMATKGLERIAPLHATSLNGHTRAHPQGVLAVLGPYNYPAHLVNAHVIPALMTGNCVVVKPSEFCPLTGELYAQCVHDAGLPSGVFNLVQGAREIGESLVSHEGVQGILFTGSYPTGRAIQMASASHAQKMVALEMGGKNTALVMDDASLAQALAAVLQGAFLTTGQRCTATSRLLLHKAIASQMIEGLVEATRQLRPGDPWKPQTPFGPLANKPAFERFVEIRGRAKKLGYEPLLEGKVLDGGAFVTPSIHLATPDAFKQPGYLDEELFGPDICVEIVDDIDHAIQRINQSPYGLSNAVFSANKKSFEKLFIETRSGLLNFNKSTNGASGELPFGGVGKSGNQRPAGIDAMRYTTYPVAVVEGQFGEVPIEKTFQPAVREGEKTVSLDFEHLLLRQELERQMELYGVYLEDVDAQTIQVSWSAFLNRLPRSLQATPELILSDLAPHLERRDDRLLIRVPHPMQNPAASMLLFDKVSQWLQEGAEETAAPGLDAYTGRTNCVKNGKLPRSEAMLRRMYKDQFVPKERKTPVVDLRQSQGPYLQSIDQDPLVILDAASQIASLGTGFRAGSFLNALDEGRLTETLLSNSPHTVESQNAVKEYESFLCERAWDSIQYASCTAGGAEANEKAFDLCRQNGPGGRRIIAFEGSFHGRTLMSLHATYNPVKRAPFEFAGYEVSFVPFPAWKEPGQEPSQPNDWVSSWFRGDYTLEPADELEKKEIESLRAIGQSIDAGDMCAVIVEPMQGEGGDNYATARFFQGLRALTRGKGVPLIFDEVQTGFGLGDTFFWHTQFALQTVDGEPDGPDCITLAKKAQVGVCLSVWPDSRTAVPHATQVQRGLIHAQDIDAVLPWSLSTLVHDQVSLLAADYPLLVGCPRQQGYAFAFDLPSQKIAMQIIKQRFYRGFMVYIAGEKTVRFRLNQSWLGHHIKELFASIREALEYMVSSAETSYTPDALPRFEKTEIPEWIDRTRSNHSSRRSIESLEKAFSENKTSMHFLKWLTQLPDSSLRELSDRLLRRHPRHDQELFDSALLHLFGPQWKSNWSPSHVKAYCRERIRACEQSPEPEQSYDALSDQDPVHLADVMINSFGARLEHIKTEDWAAYRTGIMAIENETYEEGRRETEQELKTMVDADGSYCLLGLKRYGQTDRVVGYAFGAPLENFSAQGPDRDQHRGKKNTFYSGNITVARSERGNGLGSRLKSSQIAWVKSARRADGQHRYMFSTGRNRWDNTPQMQAINHKSGAYHATHFRGGQYGEESGEAVYYRIPLRYPHIMATSKPREVIDWASSVQAPLGNVHPRMLEAVQRGHFTQPIGTKLTLSNWVTPELIRYTEVLRELCPSGLGHMYFTSGQSELVDKGLRCLRVKRPAGQTVIGFQHQYVGDTTAAARSLSSPEGQKQPYAWFDWPLLPHPHEVGIEQSLDALKTYLHEHPSASILGVVLELAGERSGLVLDAEFYEKATALCRAHDVPVIAVETASALGRVGEHLFHSDSFQTSPDMIWWYTGGQLGHIFVNDHYYVEKPLTLISTWDGDELSVVRNRLHLLEARELLTEKRAVRFDEKAKETGVPFDGKGLWRHLRFNDQNQAESFRQALKERGVLVSHGLPGRVLVAPPICSNPEEWAMGLEKITALWNAEFGRRA